MNKIARFVLALTAFAPILFVYAAVFAVEKEYCTAAVLVWICVALCGLCAGTLHFAKRQLEGVPYRAEAVETADNEMQGFLLIYCLPLITRDLSLYNWPVWIIIALLFCVMVATSFGCHFNPLLTTVLGYHFYRVTAKGGVTRILLTTRPIQKTGEKLCVAELSEYVLLEKKRPS